MIAPPTNPLRYDPALETPEPHEAETQQGLIEQILRISETTYKHGDHALRGVHAKSQGIFKGQLIVEAGLPSVLAQGLFAQPGTHDVIARLSTSPGDLLDDRISTPRGLAIKVFGAKGPRLPGSPDATTQDFVLVNGKAFGAPDAKTFLANLKMLAGTTDKAEGLKLALAATLRGAEHLVEALGGESATLKSLGGHPETHILGESFYSQVPIRYGDYVAKVGLEPLTPALKALTGGKAELHDKPNGLREDVRRFIAANGGEWAFVVQLCVDTETMPIEQAHKPWPEEHSAYIQVARLVVPPQDSFDEFIEPRQDDALAFSPWRGLAAHQPLGSIMRVRRAVYEASAKFRLEHNGCPMHEPAGLATVGA